MAQTVKNLPAMQETRVRSLGREDPLEKEMATHSSILVWKSHGQRSLEGYRPQGHKESDTTEVAEHACTRLHGDDENDEYHVQDTGHVFWAKSR